MSPLSERMARCYVAGWDQVCGLPAGHDGAHESRHGAGVCFWFTPTPRWDGLLRRWVKPEEPEYEAGLERLRHPRGAVVSCTKLRFQSRGDANESARHAKRRNSTARDMKPYLCRCGSWHLASKTHRRTGRSGAQQ